MRFIIALMCTAMVLFSTPISQAADTSLAPFAGNRRGGANIPISDGKFESVTCQSYIKATSDIASVVLRCANKSIKLVEVRAEIHRRRQEIQGTWQETVHGLEGTLVGTIDGNVINAKFIGGGTSGSVSFALHGQSLRVTFSATQLGNIVVALN